MGYGNKIKALILIAVCLWFGAAGNCAEDVKEPVVSGQFYPANPATLSSLMDDLLSQANPAAEENKQAVVLISPHAGYVFSAPVAAFGYKAIQGKPFNTVVVIGLSHKYGFAGVSIYPHGSFRTPLGDIPVDEELCKILTAVCPIIKFEPRAFAEEHSLEVQLPFLQKALGKFKLVPLLTGSPVTMEDCKEVAAAIFSAVKNRDDVLVVISTDLSHYYTQSTANKMDQKAIEYIRNLDVKGLFSQAMVGKLEACNLTGVAVGLYYAELMNARDVRILSYKTSGDTQPDIRTNGVVGYVSAIIYKEASPKKPAAKEEALPMLNPIQRKRLLNIARKTIETYLKENKRLEVKEEDPLLNKPMGAFVTLREKGQLRGCIGNIVASQPLYLTVRDMAIAAATEDPRFPSVSTDELDKIDIEISVLSEPQKVDDPNKIEMGKHGVIVRSGFRSGVFLPQVADETGWDRDTFMANLCAHKAGLPADAWKKKGVDIYIFTAEVFSEAE